VCSIFIGGVIKKNPSIIVTVFRKLKYKLYFNLFNILYVLKSILKFVYLTNNCIPVNYVFQLLLFNDRFLSVLQLISAYFTRILIRSNKLPY